MRITVIVSEYGRAANIGESKWRGFVILPAESLDKGNMKAKPLKLNFGERLGARLLNWIIQNMVCQHRKITEDGKCWECRKFVGRER